MRSTLEEAGLPDPRRLVVVIVSFNVRDYLRECLESVLRDAESQRVQVVVVDNASNDGSAVMVREEFPAVSVHENAANLGFAAACNQGMEAHADSDVLLLNPDTVVAAGALKQLAETVASMGRRALVGPRLVYPGGRTQVACARHLPNLANLVCLWSYAFAALRRMGFCWPIAYRLADSPIEVEAISGAGMLIPAEIAREVGRLRESMPMEFEDIDYCARAREHGFHVICDPRSIVTHALGASMRKTRWRSDVRALQVPLYYLWVHRGASYYATARGLFVLCMAWRCLVNLSAMPFTRDDSLYRLRLSAFLLLWGAASPWPGGTSR